MEDYRPVEVIEDPDAFHRRAQILLDAMARTPRPERDIPRRILLHAVARLATNHDVDTGLRDIEEVNDNPGDASMFFRHANIDAYLRLGHMYSEALREKVRCRMLDYAYLPRMPKGTENHKLMIAVAGFLVAQTWPEWDNAAQTALECADYLNEYLSRVPLLGQGEFDSTTYSVFYISTLATLYDFAADPALQQKALLMLHWFLANTAGDWLNGRFVGAHSRDYFATQGPEMPGAGTVAAWLYFGGREPDFARSEAHYSGINALSSYRMPAILARIARDRSAAFVHRETHDRMGPDGTVEGRGPYISRSGVRKYTYFSPGWALGSMADGREGDIVWAGQLRRWSLAWDTHRPGGALFFTHPFPDGDDADDAYLTDWRGSSPYEQVVQHEGAVVALYNIPAGGRYKMAPRDPAIRSDRDPYIDGLFSPTSILQTIEDPSGWIFCHGDSVLIAVRPLRPYRWLDDRARLRSDGLKNGVVIEAAGIEEFARAADLPSERIGAALERFRHEMLAAASVEFDLEADAPTVAYTTRRGGTIHITYNGPRLINGNPVEAADWPLIENPSMRQSVGDGILSISHGGEHLQINYNDWTITADPPPAG